MLLAMIAAPVMAIEGVWHGKYVCTQGPTGLTLTVTRTADGSGWSGRFCFCAIPENPNLPTGECELMGSVVPGQTAVRFTPWRWIAHPPGWEMRPVELWMSADGQQLFGRIDSPDCQPPFQLKRETPETAQQGCRCQVVTSQARSRAPVITP